MKHNKEETLGRNTGPPGTSQLGACLPATYKYKCKKYPQPWQHKVACMQ